MTTSCLQEKIDKLQNTVHALLHKSNYMAGVYVDDLARLNNEIHEQINDLYPCHGKTAEQEAALCLSLLMGYSVSMYANSEDEAKKETVLRRSQMILKNQLPSPLKFSYTQSTINYCHSKSTFFEKRLIIYWGIKL